MRSQRIIALALFGMLSAPFALTGCSSDGPDQAEEPAAEASEEAAAEAPAEAAPAKDEAPVEAAAEAAPAPEPAVAAPAPAPAEAPGFTAPATARYVTSYALNVRSAPSKDSPVIGHVKKGDKVDVIINGEWAKVTSGKYAGKYVSNNRLAAADPAATPAKGKKAKAKK